MIPERLNPKIIFSPNGSCLVNEKYWSVRRVLNSISGAKLCGCGKCDLCLVSAKYLETTAARQRPVCKKIKNPTSNPRSYPTYHPRPQTKPIDRE